MAATKLLEALGQAGPPGMSVEALAQQIGGTYPSVQKSCALLLRRGMADRVDRGRYRLSQAGQTALATGRRIHRGAKIGGHRYCSGSFQEKLWRALRMRRKATTMDMVTIANPEEKYGDAFILKLRQAQHYLRSLCRAGFVTALKSRSEGTSPQSRGYLCWLLIRDTGPKCPSVSKGICYDHNTGQEIELKGGCHD